MKKKEIEIRRWEPDDYVALQEIYRQPNVIRGTLQLPFPSQELWRNRLSQETEGRYGLVACIDKKPVGNLGLSVARNHRRRHTGDIGMAVHDAWQGHGVGSALLHAALEIADNWLNLSRIELSVFTDNPFAIKLYEGRGFEIEGTMRKYAFRDGEYVDTYMMARLR